MADSASSSTDDTSFDITVDDTSPTISYSPFADGFGASTSADGWNPCFSISGAPKCESTLEQASTNATTLHGTAADGASLAVQWNGTAISLFGYFPTDNSAFPSKLSYSVSLDGISTTNYASSLSPSVDIAQDVLVAFTNLSDGEHRIQVTMHNPTGLSGSDTLLLFDRAVITSNPPPSTLPPNSTIATQVFPDDAISYRGQWSFERDLLPAQGLSFHSSTNVGDSASMQFNGTAVTLSGLTTPSSGSYNITLDNEPPIKLSARSSSNASTLLFFRTGLDPEVPHQLNIINVGATADGEGTLLIVGSVNVTSAAQSSGGSTSAMSSSLPRGTIAALSVGIAIAVVVLLALAFYFVRRRRQAARRKQGLIVNPRISGIRRLSFLTKQSRQVNAEKEREANVQGLGYTNDPEILDISARKEDDDEDITEESGLQLPDPYRADSRHASQNSDGSYSIKLPDLPSKGYARPRSEDDALPPSRPFVTTSRTSQSSQHSPIPHSPTPRSPKPRGPREMHSPTLSHGRGGSQGILLKEMYSPTADVPTDVREGDIGTFTTTDGTFLPAPTISPLRVNFEEEISFHGERRKDWKYRSGVSAISLPQSLRQAFSWGHDPQRQSAPATQTTMLDSSRQQDPRYSFLDLESTASNSVSGGTRSTRHSRTTSTRSSAKSQRAADDSEWSAPGKPNMPPVPQDQRTSMGFSMTIAGGPTSSRPSLSPDISLRAVPLPHLTVTDDSPPHAPQDVPQSAHPHELSELLPSPTDSIPMSVSDIHFRHSSQSSTSITESRRTSRRVSHPPLPGTPGVDSTEQRPYIVQRLLGRHDPDSGPSTPFSSPTTPAFRPSGPRMSRGRGSLVGLSFSSAMSKPRAS